MNGDVLYLKPNVVIQPLIDRWYAWSHLIPPATLGLNHLDRHLRIMDSYVDAPQVHAHAVRDPDMAGGPFFDLNGERVDDIRRSPIGSANAVSASSSSAGRCGS